MRTILITVTNDTEYQDTNKGANGREGTKISSLMNSDCGQGTLK